MGTNYYAHKNACPHCKRGEEVYHIGKSSGGWAFSLHVCKWAGVNNIHDLYSILHAPGTIILDEYNREISLQDMKDLIEKHEPCTKRNLERHKIDGKHCIGHGDGNYDLIRGEFS